VVRPAITVLSSISYDHTAIFGSTIKAIAESEAGIIKPGCPVVAAPQVFLDAKNVIIAKTTLEKSELLLIDEKCRFTEIRHSLDGQTFSIEFLDGEKKWNGQYKLSLLGRHQIENTTTALTALRRLTELGFVITKKKVQLGLQAVRWPCRFEVVSRHPLIVLDSAHNVDSAQKLKSTITKYLGDRKIILIFGASADKDIKGMFEVLLPGIQKVILTKSAHPRAAEPAMLVKLVSSGSVPFETTENINEAIEMAKRETDQKSAIVVAGSIFIAAAARQVIQNSQRQEIE
jgi:dihydrofolate synthase/folylpolyglutamate synthase